MIDLDDVEAMDPVIDWESADAEGRPFILVKVPVVLNKHVIPDQFTVVAMTVEFAAEFAYRLAQRCGDIDAVAQRTGAEPDNGSPPARN